MAVVNSFEAATLSLKTSSSHLPTSSFPFAPSTAYIISTGFLPFALSASRKRRGVFSQSVALKNEIVQAYEVAEEVEEEMQEPCETVLYSLSPLPLLFVAALPGA
ncbi:hypothetical protein Patl1_32194 [Pistacia atlantica]|uniref:Uncharacterized protein n=1 Tax=Pistacia atlantica TaxID=434234 RepID=A0ACC1AQ51_9ROSI|nr:hypothetical protein Patl1_32194 [Pistacia atlantica]